ncbi:MAG TPA: hypothetical protein VJS92_00715 [Candidatus Polarisedimenticolaceae bacterium]|nr:hypothetical protein [Candidatus Polarisedimenticolaceae bacterium]
MIVNCPSCRTRYRHDAAAAASLALARCSRCEECFPFPRSRRPYVLVTPRSAPAIGLDDPLLAPRLERTAFDLQASPGPEAADFRDRFEAAVRPEPRIEPESELALEPSIAEAELVAPARRSARSGLLALFLTMVGFGAAYAWAWRSHENPVVWSAIGGGGGLLLGWLVTRWTARKR